MSACRCADTDAESCAFVAGVDSCSCSCHTSPPATSAPRAAQTFRIVHVHRCAAKFCDATIALERLMCPACWRLVPRELQDAVWRNYRSGQERDGRITLDYARSARAAIEAVAEAKRRTHEREQAKAAQGKLFE